MNMQEFFRVPGVPPVILKMHTKSFPGLFLEISLRILQGNAPIILLEILPAIFRTFLPRFFF